MIQIVLYPNTNQRIAEAYGKWFPRVANTETVALEELSFVFFFALPVCAPKGSRPGASFYPMALPSHSFASQITRGRATPARV